MNSNPPASLALGLAKAYTINVHVIRGWKFLCGVDPLYVLYLYLAGFDFLEGFTK